MQKEKGLGHHTILDLYDCDAQLLDEPEKIEDLMLEAAKIAKVTIIKSHFHRFSPQGVSGSIIIAESHFSIHTWPENGFAAIDLFTCGNAMNYKEAADFLIEKFQCKRHELNQLVRGIL